MSAPLNVLSQVSPPPGHHGVPGGVAWDRYKLRGVCEKLLSLEDPAQLVTSGAGLLPYLGKPLCFEVLGCIIAQDHTPYDAEAELSAPDYARPNVFPTSHDNNPGGGGATAETRLAYQACILLFAPPREEAGIPSNPLTGRMADALRLRGVELIRPVFRALRTVDSQASIFHLCFAIQNMIRIVPDVVTAHLAEIGARTKMIIEALIENAQCSGVPTVLVDLFTLRLASPENPLGCRGKDMLTKYKKRLLQYPWLSMALTRVLEADASSDVESHRASGLADFVVGVLTRYSSFTELGELETTLLKPLVNVHMFEKLLEVAATPSDTELRNIAISLLGAFAKLAVGKLASDLAMDSFGQSLAEGGAGALDDEAGRLELLKKRQANLAKATPNKVFLDFSRDIKTMLLPLLTARLGGVLGQQQQQQQQLLLLQQRHTSYTTEEPFTLRRLEVMKLLKDSVFASPERDSARLLSEAVPWAVLCKWFAAYPNNSMFLCEFTDLFSKALMAEENEMDAARKIVCDCKLVSFFVTRLKSAASASDHAHVVKCCNIIRLRAEQLPKKHWLVQYLKSHSGWLDAQDTLMAATKAQLQPLVRATSLGSAPADMEDSPAAAIARDLFGNDPENPLMQGGPPDSLVGEMEREQTDIELGSAFARSLGFYTSPTAVAPRGATGASASASTSAVSAGSFEEADMVGEEEEPAKKQQGGGGKGGKGKKKKR